jgi:hypothetical protein
MLADDNLAALAAAGGAAVAMTTVTWPDARHGIVRVVGIHGLHRQAAGRAQMDGASRS